MKIRAALSVAVLAFGAGCASSPSAAAEAAGGQARASRGNPNIITEAELAGTNYQSVYEAIEQLRPQFFRGRGGSSQLGRESMPVIYVDNQRVAGSETLRSLAPSGVSEIRYLTDLQATQRFGPDHDAGAIVVMLKRR